MFSWFRDASVFKAANGTNVSILCTELKYNVPIVKKNGHFFEYIYTAYTLICLKSVD